jgi:AcrR family transcriptional regulator
MTNAGWLRDERDALAAERILDAAGRVFAELGVAQAGMADIAAAAGCSRATVYRYFESRLALRTAYVHREARRVADEVVAALVTVDDPHHRVVAGILLAVAAVRRSPEMSAWFTGDSSGLANDLAGSSQVIEVLAARFLTDSFPEDDEGRQRARWLVRTIVSFLTMPGADAEEERLQVERFVAPIVLQPQGARR